MSAELERLAGECTWLEEDSQKTFFEMKVRAFALAWPSGSELRAALSIVGANNSQTRRLRAEPSALTMAGRKAPTDAGWSLCCCCCRRRTARPRAR